MYTLRRMEGGADMSSKIEAELVKFAKMRRTVGDFDDEQDYLASLVLAISKAGDRNPDGYEDLSVGADDWFNAAVVAHNNDQEIPEFPDAITEEGPAELEFEDAKPDKPEAEDEPQEGAVTPDQAIEESGQAAAEESVAESENEAQEAEAAKPKRKGKAKAKAETKVKKAKPEARVYTTLQRDEYGVTLGTKTHDALMLYETGKYTKQEVTDKMGGTFYNILRTVAKAGHKVEINSNGKVKVTHRDKVKKEKPNIMDIDSDVAD
jgi:hypothetical protein